MTREEAKNRIIEQSSFGINEYISWSSIDDIFDSLEARIVELDKVSMMTSEGYRCLVKKLETRIAELEAPRSCDGCAFSDYPNRFNSLNTCKACCRSGLTDFYEPKENQDVK